MVVAPPRGVVSASASRRPSSSSSGVACLAVAFLVVAFVARRLFAVAFLARSSSRRLLGRGFFACLLGRPSSSWRCRGSCGSGRLAALPTLTRDRRGSARGTGRCSCPATAATSSGVPSATTRPPRLPPSGPRSISQSAVLITSRLCSMTMTVLPWSTSRCSTRAACGCPRSAARWSARRARRPCGRSTASAARRPA